MIDDRTPNLNLPLPSVDNLQTDDILRMRTALGAIDTAVAAKADLVGGKVPSGQLPSYVDDVLEYVNMAAFPATGEAGKLYLALDSGLLYRWSGSAYTDLPANYTLPPATPSTRGGVKVGSGLNVAPDGTLSTVGGGAGSGLPVFNELAITPTTNGQTVFTPAGGYSPGQIELFLNGLLLLGNGDDYSATDGVDITLTTGANTADTLFLRRWIYLPEAQAVAKTGDTMTGALNWAAPVSVASAATCNIGLDASNLVTVTGTATITSLGVVAAGVQRTVVFDGALTLTHSAGLILPGAASIVTAAGDSAVFQSLGGGNWRCTSYHRGDGTPFRVVPVANGGTGSATAEGANRNLVVGSTFRETGNGTMASGATYSIWTGGGPVSMSLPAYADTLMGDRIYIRNLHLHWAVNNFTVVRQANTQIMQLAENLVCNVNVGSIVLTCVWKDANDAFWNVSVGG